MTQREIDLFWKNEHERQEKLEKQEEQKKTDDRLRLENIENKMDEMIYLIKEIYLNQDRRGVLR